MSQSNDMIVRTAAVPTLILGASTVIMGWASATVHGNGEFLPAVLCLFFAMFMQLYNNWNHRFYDIKYKLGEYIDDGYDLSDSDVLTSHTLIHEMSKGALVLAAMVGIGLMMLAGWWTIVIGIIVFLVAWFNSHGNTPLLRTSFNVVVTFLIFGPIGVIATDLVQSATGHTNRDFLNPYTDNLSWFDLGPAVMLCIPAGLMAMSAHLAHGFRKHDLDIDNNKQTLVTALGQRRTATIYLICGILIPVSYLLFWFFINPTPPLWLLLIAPVIVSIYMITRYRVMLTHDHLETKFIEEETAYAYLFLALCTYILCLTTGSPNDSPLILYDGF